MDSLFEFFRMTRKERRGFWVLCCLLVAVVLFPLIYHLLTPKENINYQLIALSSDSETKYQQSSAQEVAPGLVERSYVRAKPKAELFDFDPNGLPVSDWQRLGLSARQAQVIKNYEAKGGRFRTKEDVRKMFVISEERYAALEPYIRIKPVEQDRQPPLPTYTPEAKRTVRTADVAPASIDINMADTTEWKSLRGIGTAYANRIVKFRDALGGFHDMEQLKEVYGMTEELFEQIQSRLTLEQPLFRKIEINSCSQDDLRVHPYISYKQAQAIVRYRYQHGRYSSIEDLRKIVILDEDFLRKIEPYLVFEN